MLLAVRVSAGMGRVWRLGSAIGGRGGLLPTQSGHPATLICKARARTERGLWMATCLDRLVYSLVRGFRSRFCQMGGAGAGASLTTAAVSA